MGKERAGEAGERDRVVSTCEFALRALGERNGSVLEHEEGASPKLSTLQHTYSASHHSR